MSDTRQSSITSSSALPASTTLAALASLIRRGTVAYLMLAADGSRSVEIRPARSSVSLPRTGSGGSTRLPYGQFREAREAGWLVPSDDGDSDGEVSFVLSPIARHLLRRLKSSTGVAPPTGQTTSGTHHAASGAILPPLPIAPVPHIDPAESPLAWLRRHKDKSGRPLISALQLEAGERLRSDLWKAEMTPRVTIDWNRIGGGGTGSGGRNASAPGVEMRDAAANAAQRVRRALSALGPVSAGLLIDVCGHLVGLEEIERRRGWPLRSGKIALQIALSELARHYRLPGADTTEATIATGLRAWRA